MPEPDDQVGLVVAPCFAEIAVQAPPVVGAQITFAPSDCTAIVTSIRLLPPPEYPDGAVIVMLVGGAGVREIVWATQLSAVELVAVVAVVAGVDPAVACVAATSPSAVEPLAMGVKPNVPAENPVEPVPYKRTTRSLACVVVTPGAVTVSPLITSAVVAVAVNAAVPVVVTRSSSLSVPTRAVALLMLQLLAPAAIVQVEPVDVAFL